MDYLQGTDEMVLNLHLWWRSDFAPEQFSLNPTPRIGVDFSDVICTNAAKIISLIDSLNGFSKMTPQAKNSPSALSQVDVTARAYTSKKSKTSRKKARKNVNEGTAEKSRSAEQKSTLSEADFPPLGSHPSRSNNPHKSCEQAVHGRPALNRTEANKKNRKNPLIQVFGESSVDVLGRNKKD